MFGFFCPWASPWFPTGVLGSQNETSAKRRCPCQSSKMDQHFQRSQGSDTARCRRSGSGTSPAPCSPPGASRRRPGARSESWLTQNQKRAPGVRKVFGNHSGAGPQQPSQGRSLGVPKKVPLTDQGFGSACSWGPGRAKPKALSAPRQNHSDLTRGVPLLVCFAHTVELIHP